MRTDTPPPRNPRPRIVGVRQTEPQGYNPYAQGGFSVIPRRGTRLDVCDRDGLQRVAEGSPLRLLKLLPEVHPAVGLALWNALRLACAPGDLNIVAVVDDGGAEDVDEAGSAALDALWRGLPREVGGFRGLQTMLTQEALLTGMPCLEAVPGARMRGLAQVWPVDSLSIAFKRDQATGEVVPLQRQLFLKTGGEKFQGYQVLKAETFFWLAVDPMVDEPYGRAPYAPAVAEALADIAMMVDLRDAIHHSAWPRYGHGFNFKEMHEVATTIYHLEDAEAREWVQARFNEVMAQVASVRPDDDFVYDSAGDVKNLTPGDGFQAITGVLQFLRARVTQSLKSLPTLMGINDGSTQTYTTVEWGIYAAGLESVREIVADLIVNVANLHLRLLGMTCVAKTRVKPIRTTDGLLEAQSEKIRIDNEIRKVRLGWISEEEAAVAITGTPPVAPPMPGAYGEIPERANAPQDDTIREKDPEAKG
jgi:hypothetical protein